MEEKISIKRYPYIDLIKTIAIIMVIILHAGLLKVDFIRLKTVTSAIQYSFRIISEGVPLFIMVNGFLLLPKEKFDLKKHLKKTLKIFELLIIWSILYIILETILQKGQLSVELIFKNVLTTSINNKYTGILWFLQNLIMLYLIYPILKYLYDTNKQLYNYLFVIVIVSSVGLNFIDMINSAIIKITNFEKLSLITTYINKFNILSNCQFLMFFMLGGFLYEKKDMFIENKTKIKYIIIALISWIVSFSYALGMSYLNNKTYSSSFNYASMFMIFIIIGIFAITNFYEDKGYFYNKIVTYVGKNSLGIYLTHKIITDIISIYIPKLNTGIELRCMKVVLVLIFSVIITWLLEKNTITKWIIKT